MRPLASAVHDCINNSSIIHTALIAHGYRAMVGVNVGDEDNLCCRAFQMIYAYLTAKHEIQKPPMFNIADRTIMFAKYSSTLQCGFGWLRVTVGKTFIFDRRTFPVHRGLAADG